MGSVGDKGEAREIEKDDEECGGKREAREMMGSAGNGGEERGNGE